MIRYGYRPTGCTLLLGLCFILIVIKCKVNERTVSLGAGVNSWKLCRSPKTGNNGLISCGGKKIMKTRRGLCNV